MRTIYPLKKIGALFIILCFTLPYFAVSAQTPVIGDIPGEEIAEGSEFTAINLDDYVEDNEPDHALIWTYSENIDLEVNIENHIALVSVPDENWNGTETIIFSVNDSDLNQVSDGATFTVTPVNDAPVVIDIPDQSILKRGSFEAIDLNNHVTDVDNNVNDFVWAYSGNTDLAVSIDDLNLATIDAPDLWTGSETISFTVTDGIDVSVENTASFTAIETIPVAGNDILTVDEGGNLSTPAPGVLSNDSDADGDALAATLVSGPVYGSSFVLNGDGSLDYVHNGSESMQDIITYRANDGDDNSELATVTININPVNDLPVISTIEDRTIQEGESFPPIALDELVSDAEDTDDLLAWVAASENGNLEVDIDGTTRVASINPTNPHWNGSETITFTVTDTESGTASNDAVFTILDLAAAPAAVDDGYNVAEGGTLTILPSGVLSNDTDGDLDPLTADLITGPSYSSSFTLNPDGSFTYVHNGGETLQDVFTYRAFDGTSQSNTATVTITITTVNDAPVLTELSGSGITFIEDNGAVQLTPGMLVSDADHANLASATITIAAGFQSSEDVLSFIGSGGITGSYNAGTGVLSLNGSATVADYQTVLRTVRYNNTSQNPNTTLRTVNTVVSDGALASNTIAKTVTIQVQNDSPVVADIPGQTINEGLTFSTINLDNYVEDPDNADNQIVWTYFGQSQLGVSITSRVATITIPNTDWFGSESITFAATDPLGGYDSDAATFTVTAVNDPPVLSDIETSSLAYAEGSGEVQITNTIAVSDVDNPNLASAVITISSNYQNDQDVLSFTNGAFGLTRVWNGATGQLTLTGNVTQGNFQAALRTVKYSNSSSDPSTLTRTITFRVNDGTINSIAQTRNITINASNTAPVLADPNVSIIGYTENDPPVQLTNTITITDPDNTTLTSATAIITVGLQSAEDTLSFTSGNGISGVYTPATGTLALSGSSSLANYRTALRSVRYRNTSNNPNLSTRVISFTVHDGAAPSNSIEKTLTIATVNDAPVLADPVSTSINYTENTASVQLTSTITITDADNTMLVSASIAITSGFQTTEDTLSFTAANGITGNYSTSTGILSLTGSATLVNYRTALRSVRYRNRSENPTAANRTVAFTVNDGGSVNNTSNIINRTITITPVNDPPVATLVIITAANDRIGTLNTGSFQYTDPDDALPGTHTYKWYRSDNVGGIPATAIAGAIATTYRPVKADGGKYICFEVTPVDPHGMAGSPQKSAFRYINAAPVASNAHVYAPLVQPGENIKGRFTYFDRESNPRGVSIYHWYRANGANPTPASPGAAIGTTDSTYRIVSADAGKYLWFRVHPVATAGSTPGDSVWSNVIGPIGSFSANISLPEDTFCYGETMPITLTITAGKSPFIATLTRTGSTLNKDTVISNITTSPRIIQVKIPGYYVLKSLKDADNDEADVPATPVRLVINPRAKALLTGTAAICNDGITKASLSANFTSGASPWTITVRRTNSAGNTIAADSVFTGIVADPFLFNARVINNNATRHRIIAISDAAGCPGDTTSGSAWVSFKPSPTATISGIDSICPGDNATLTVSLTSGTPNWGFTYRNGENPVVVVPKNIAGYTYTLQVNNPGTYTISLVEDALCTGKGSGLGIVEPYTTPTATISGSATICEHTSGNLTVSLGGDGPWRYSYRQIGGDTVDVFNVYDSPNTFSVNKAGTYSLVEVYDEHCKGSVSGTAVITVTQAPDVQISGLAPAYNKTYEGMVPVTGTPAGGTFSGPGLFYSSPNWFFLPPYAPVGTNNIVYAYRSSPATCYGYDTAVVRILEARALIEFENNRTNYCMNDAPFIITGVNLLGSIGNFTISGGIGLVDHGDNTATVYPTQLTAKKYTITYTYYEDGLPQPVPSDFYIGEKPKADFIWDTECFQAGQSIAFTNTSSSTFGYLTDSSYFWKIYNNTGFYYDTLSDISYTFPEPGNHRVELQVINTYGCTDKVTRTFALRPIIPLQGNTYFENFESEPISWQSDSLPTINVNSWMLGNPSKGFTGPVTDETCWYTLTQSTRPPREQSWVTSPCFDFTGTDRPMLTMDVWRLFNANRDGANVQFSADSGKTWTLVGQIGDGVDWFNSYDINGNPGGSSIGWANKDGLHNDTDWAEVRHSLDMVKGLTRVQFRIAYGSDGSAQNNNGIAFDHIWIGERNRTALIEHFTNSSDPLCDEADAILDEFVMNNELNVIDLQYHTDIPSNDPFYEDNPVIPTTRRGYYGITDIPVPYALLNGGSLSQHRFDYTESNPLNENTAIIESLLDSKFQVVSHAYIDNATLYIETEVTARQFIPETTVSVRIAVVEREINGITGENGDTLFRNVVKTMLPGAAGKSLHKEWEQGSSNKIDVSWNIQNVYDASQLRVIAFVQDESDSRIYQATMDTIGVPTGIDNPWVINPSEKSFIVYPNPANRTAFVRFEQEVTRSMVISVYNSVGRLVYSTKLASGDDHAEIPAEALPDGLYLLRITDSNKIIGTSKLIISK